MFFVDFCVYVCVFFVQIEIEDLDFDEEKKMFFYPCPCGDKFQISLVCPLREKNHTKMII